MGTMLRAQLFATGADTTATCSWPLIANALQRALLRGTRQSPMAPKRSLSIVRGDWDHLRKLRADNAQQLSAKQFLSVWDFVGKVIQALRYKRHIGTMWQSGIVQLLVPIERLRHELSRTPAGTAAVFFSESNPGLFCVLYTVASASAGGNAGDNETNDDGNANLTSAASASSGASPTGNRRSLLAPDQIVANSSRKVTSPNSAALNGVSQTQQQPVDVQLYDLRVGDTFGAKRTLAHFLLECSQFKSILVQSSGGAQGQFEQRPKTELLLQFLSPKDSLRVALEADAEQEGVQQQEPVNNDDNIL